MQHITMGGALSGLASEAQDLLLATRSGDIASVAKVSTALANIDLKMEISALHTNTFTRELSPWYGHSMRPEKGALRVCCNDPGFCRSWRVAQLS